MKISRNLGLAGLCSLAFGATAHAAPDAGGFYIGAFGGAGSAGAQSLEQTSTAHKGFAHEDAYYTYDLQVDVDGRTRRDTSAVFGGQIGYEWETGSAFKPALEVEGLYLSATQRGHLANPADEGVANVKVTTGGVPAAVTDEAELAMVREHVLGTEEEPMLRAGHHTFANSAKMRVAMFALNGVLSYKIGSKFTPYVGGGLGFAFISMRDAISHQTGPGGVETGKVLPSSDTTPVNHFNSRTHANDFAFAAQAKVGLRYSLTSALSLFAEYRYIRLASADYTFGSTVYSTHAPTDNWVVRNGSMSLHNGLIGLRLGF